jgi:hypothetical protein
VPATVTITGGSVVVAQFLPLATVHVQGTQGFRLDGFADATNHFGNSCRGCAPGDEIFLTQNWNELAAAAEVEVNGVIVRFPATDNNLGFFFIGDAVTVPPLSTNAVLSAPFELQGMFVLPDVDGEPGPQFDVVGHGIARVFGAACSLHCCNRVGSNCSAEIVFDLIEIQAG